MIQVSDPDEYGKQELIDTTADHFDVDLNHAVVAKDQDPESDRIYIIEEADGGYRLMEYGLMAGYPEEGYPASEEALFIPETAVGAVQGLLHAAGLHVTNHGQLTSDGTQISIRDLAEGMGVSEPLQDGGDR